MPQFAQRTDGDDYIIVHTLHKLLMLHIVLMQKRTNLTAAT